MAQRPQSREDLAWPAVAVFGAQARAPIVLVCEHASRFIPPALNGLGANQEARRAHVAYDIGAMDMAKRLSTQLDAPLVAGQISRLVYDCNRPLEAPDCIPGTSEIFVIPGNENLSPDDKQARFDQIHTPFHEAVDQVLDTQISRCSAPITLVTLHSFTPVYNGVPRQVEIGYLHHDAGDLARAATAIEATRGVYTAQINAPYSASDGVTYSLKKHGDARGLESIMVEVRNDLIDTPAKAQTVADHLAETLLTAIEKTQQEAVA